MESTPPTGPCGTEKNVVLRGLKGPILHDGVHGAREIGLNQAFFFVHGCHGSVHNGPQVCYGKKCRCESRSNSKNEDVLFVIKFFIQAHVKKIGKNIKAKN